MLHCKDCGQRFESEGGKGSTCPACRGVNTAPFPEPSPSAITIRFFAPGSVAFNLEAEGRITAGQLVAAGQFLLDEGRFAWDMNRQRQAIAEAQKQAESQIAVPGVGPQQVMQILRGRGGTD